MDDQKFRLPIFFSPPQVRRQTFPLMDIPPPSFFSSETPDSTITVLYQVVTSLDGAPDLIQIGDMEEEDLQAKSGRAVMFGCLVVSQSRRVASPHLPKNGTIIRVRVHGRRVPPQMLD